MPKASKNRSHATPLLQISWTTQAKGRAKSLVITFGGPLFALILLLSNPHLELVKKATRSILAALGAGP